MGQAPLARFVPLLSLLPPSPGEAWKPPPSPGRSLSGQKGQPRAEAVRAGASRGLETALPE